MSTFNIVLDDIGAVESIDDAAIDLSEKGIITGVSIFSNGVTDISRFKKYKGILQLGLHLTFSYAKPISKICDLHFIDEHGNFLMPIKPLKATDNEIIKSVNEYLHNLEQGSCNELKNECNAQFQQFISIFGSKPDFINVHHDLDKCEYIQNILYDVFPEYKTRAMLLADKTISYKYFCHFLPENKKINELQQEVIYLIKCGIDHSNNYGSAEVVFHPAKSNKGLKDFSSYNTMRVTEYNILMGDAVQEILSTH